MPDLDDLAAITDETVNMLKAQTNGITQATGITGLDLSGLTSLVPVDTPFRNGLARHSSDTGDKLARWRTLLNVNASQPDASTPFDTAGSLTVFSEQDVFAPYVPLELVAIITQDSIDLAKGYAEALATGTLQNLNQVMISEDINLLMAQNYALPTIATPVVTQTATTGGTIGSGAAVHVKVCARSGKNYYYGGSGPASSDGTVTVDTTSSTHTATATVTAVKGAVAYDWYVGSSSSNQVYYTTTTVNTVLITSIPTAAQALPSLPLLSTVAPTTPPTADTSFASDWMNGLLAATLGDYGSTGPVTPGSGTSSGAYWKSLDGAFFTASGQGIAELDTLNLSIWNSVFLSPTRYLMNAEEAVNITVKMLSSNRAFTMLQSATNGRADITAGGWVTHYINNSTGGTPIGIEVHPHIPPGTVIAVTDRVPFPGANIDTVLSVRTLRDYYAFEYPPSRTPSSGPTGPRHEVAVRSIETLVHKAPPVCGVIQNIGNG